MCLKEQARGISLQGVRRPGVAAAFTGVLQWVCEACAYNKRQKQVCLEGGYWGILMLAVVTSISLVVGYREPWRLLRQYKAIVITVD